MRRRAHEEVHRQQLRAWRCIELARKRPGQDKAHGRGAQLLTQAFDVARWQDRMRFDIIRRFTVQKPVSALDHLGTRDVGRPIVRAPFET